MTLYRVETWQIDTKNVDLPASRVGTYRYHTRHHAEAAVWAFLGEGLAVKVSLEYHCQADQGKPRAGE